MFSKLTPFVIGLTVCTYLPNLLPLLLLFFLCALVALYDGTKFNILEALAPLGILEHHGHWRYLSINEVANPLVAPPETPRSIPMMGKRMQTNSQLDERPSKSLCVGFGSPSSTSFFTSPSSSVSSSTSSSTSSSSTPSSSSIKRKHDPTMDSHLDERASKSLCYDFGSPAFTSPPSTSSSSTSSSISPSSSTPSSSTLKRKQAPTMDSQLDERASKSLFCGFGSPASSSSASASSSSSNSRG